MSGLGSTDGDTAWGAGTAPETERMSTKKSDNPSEPFKKALGEATRALAGEAELEITYSADPSGKTATGFRLPQVSRRMTKSEVQLARGTADAYALRERFHNPETIRPFCGYKQLQYPRVGLV